MCARYGQKLVPSQNRRKRKSKKAENKKLKGGGKKYVISRLGLMAKIMT